MTKYCIVAGITCFRQVLSRYDVWKWVQIELQDLGYNNRQTKRWWHSQLSTRLRIKRSQAFHGVDLWNGTKIVKNFRGPYATHTFSEKARSIIKHHNTAKPLFLYLTPNAPHTGNWYMPLQAPLNIVNKFNHIKNRSRKVYAAMVSALDDLVGSVFEILHQKNMLRDSIVVFVSDNGGDLNEQHSSNHPLRGRKFGWWEGGIRVPALVWSPHLRLQEPRVSMQLMHMSDWLPTLYSVAGGDVSDLGDIDGHNMWNALTDELPSPRQELLHALDPIHNVSALRNDHLKLVTGNLPYSSQSPSGATGLEDMPFPSSMDRWVFQRGSVVRDILRKIGLYLPKTPDAWRRQAGPIRCKNASDGNKCDPLLRPCLFNITADPCENNNIAEKHPKIVSSMMEQMENYKAAAVKPQFKERDLHADPECHGFVHVSWLDAEHRSNCPFGLKNKRQSETDIIYSFKGKTIFCKPFTPLECYRIYWETLVR